MGGRIVGSSAGDEVGHSVVIGDFNGDGSDDLYLGAPGRDDAGTGSGAAYTFYGPLGGSEYTASTQYDAGIFGSSGLGLGYGLTNFGDQDGDGADDVAVTGTSGQLYVVSGVIGSSAIASSFPSVTSSESSDNFGYRMDGTGDLDGDGVNDLVVTAPTADNSVSDAGAAYVFHGPITTATTTGDAVAFRGSDTNDYVGYSASSGGDVDGDGLDDLLIGSTSGVTSGSPYDGGAYLVHGPATSGGNLITVADGSYGSPSTSAFCGTSLSSSADVDGDGTADVMISCVSEDVGRFTANGAVYLVYEASTGHVELGASARARVRGADDYEYLGNPIGVTDIDGDGYDEMLIGTGSADVAGLNTGRAAVFLGGSW